MKGTPIIIAMAALAVAGASTAGILLNSKKARFKRMAKRTGRAMYTVGTVLRTLSCVEA